MFSGRPHLIGATNQEGLRPGSTRGSAWINANYWIALSPAVVLIFVGWFVPEYQPNEPGRLISTRQFFDPSFPASDWLQIAGYSQDRLTIAFNALLSPLWLATKDPILVALTGRFIAWTLLVYAVVRLARAMDVPSYALAWGLPLWIGYGQFLGAGEWIFGGVEGKCFAYALLFLGLAAALERRGMMVALFCGLSWFFHVPVAAWGTLGVGGALAFRFRDYGHKRLQQFGLITLPLLLPMALFGLNYTGVSGLVGGNPYADWLVVVFRNPQHLDPNYFHGGREFLELVGCAAVTAVGLSLVTSRHTTSFLSFFLGILVVEFGAGLIARKLGFFWFLKTYPFRVADVLVPLLFALILPALAVNLVSRLYQKDVSARSVLALRATGVALLLVVGTTYLLSSDAHSGRRNLRAFAESWVQYARHTTTPYHEMTHWISANTPKSATIITSGWDIDFWLEAERAEVVNFKRNPHNALVIPWYQRYCALNGGTFYNVGLQTETEIEANFPSLSVEQIDEIHKRYGGDYYMTTKLRSDLRARLVHGNGLYYLYAIADKASENVLSFGTTGVRIGTDARDKQYTQVSIPGTGSLQFAGRYW